MDRDDLKSLVVVILIIATAVSSALLGVYFTGGW